MTRRHLLALATLLLLPAAAHAQSGCATPSGIPPYARVLVNDACLDLGPWLADLHPGGISSVATPLLHIGGGTVQLTATLDADPFITFGATTTNVVPGPVTFAFLFGTPILPGTYRSATLTGSASVTTGAGGAATMSTGGIYPTYLSGYGTLGLVATNLGVDLGSAPCTASGGPGPVTTACGTLATGVNFAPTLYDNLEALVTYDQAGLGSQVSWSGMLTISTDPLVSAVPEPATLALVLTGLGAVGGAGAVRRRRAQTSR